MKAIDEQMRLEDVSDEYKNFVEKFKTKKNTDDCYTPENIYNVVLFYACERYGIEKENVVRPFYPGGDYERYPYTEDSVVVDNPPFSILSKILDYYTAREIKFFLFAPYLTMFSVLRKREGICAILTDSRITYENGATVNTGFFTNLEDEYLFKSAPDLQASLKIAIKENRKTLKKNHVEKQIKYIYPTSVLTGSDVGSLSTHGVNFGVKKEEAFFVERLDAQKGITAIYGKGYIISEAAERRYIDAVTRAQENKKELEWHLSDREERLRRGLK